MAIEDGWLVINATDIEIRPSATSSYRFNGKVLSRGEYGNRSPQIKPCGATIELYFTYREKSYRTSVGFGCDGTVFQE